MPKVWLRCDISQRRGYERIVTILNASGTPIAFFAKAHDIIDDEGGGGHVRVALCGRRAEFVLCAVLGGDLANTNFVLVHERDIVFGDTYDGTDALMLPTRITPPTREEARANYSSARSRYRVLREKIESFGEDPAILDELWIAVESAFDPFVRWEVITDEELGNDPSTRG